MLDELFAFPTVMIDGDNEERKMRNKPDLGLPSEEEEEEYDIVYGEAEYPYWDFVGIEDRWLPTTESLQLAMTGKFEACIVRFLHAGQILVPWTKKKFKAELAKFQAAYEAAHPPKQTEKAKAAIPIMTLTQDQYQKIVGDGNKPQE